MINYASTFENGNIITLEMKKFVNEHSKPIELDRTLFWNQHNLELKLNQFKNYYNDWRAHSSLGGVTPTQSCLKLEKSIMQIRSYRWKKFCGNLFQLPVAA